MKVAIVLLVTLGLIALSECAPALEENPMAAETDGAAMNDLADPNCGPDDVEPSAEPSTIQQSNSKKSKKGKGGKGKKDGGSS